MVMVLVLIVSALHKRLLVVFDREFELVITPKKKKTRV
jgi:hypothetical protein